MDWGGRRRWIWLCEFSSLSSLQYVIELHSRDWASVGHMALDGNVEDVAELMGAGFCWTFS